MGSSDVTIGLAFVAGLISFISPCVLPLVPAYVGYMGGRMTRQVAQTGRPGGASLALVQRFGTFIHGLFFVLGFTLFFVLFGLLTTAAVSSLTSLGVTEAEVTDAIARLGGTAVVLFGLHIMGILNRVFTWLLKQAARLDQNPYGNVISTFVALALIGVTYWLFVESWFLTLVAVLVFTQVFNDALKTGSPGAFWSQVLTRIQTVLYADTRRQSQPTNRYGYLGSLFMGVVFSAGWTPCIGPIYGSVLTMASSGGSVPEAGTLMTAYSLGLGIPFLLTALALDETQGVFRRLQRNMHTIEIVSGVFLILIGALVFSGQLERLSQIGNQGELGDISLNLEHCVVGAFEGRVRWGNVPDCITDGPKPDFYITQPKIAAADVGAAPDESVAAVQSSPGPELSPGPDSGVDPVAIPELAPPLEPPQLSPDPAPGPEEVVEGLGIGKRAPDFTAKTLDGGQVSLSDFRGQAVLLNFWATYCGPCREEMPDFQTIYDLHREDGFVVLAVNYREMPGDVAAFVEDMGVTFPVLLDESGAINDNLYGPAIFGYPTSLLVDAEGVIVAYFPSRVSGRQLLDALEPLLAS